MNKPRQRSTNAPMATAAATAPPPPQRRSWMARTVLETVSRQSAKLGLVCIGFVAFCAIFAPFLANSRPLLVKMDGHYSSPVLQHLTPTDVFLLIAFAMAVVLMPLRRIKFTHKVAQTLGVLLLAAPIVILWVQPPKAVVYEEHRQAEQAGQYESALWAPIPYSPTDRLRDQFNPDQPHPWQPSPQHWLGTERNGADILSRMIHA